MSEPGKAVFLSYASQDTEAAKKICNALRAAGVEVWFDQSELVGGDAWDQKIRKQIKECALFLPILSQTTQGRREAYFRLEWKLADERTHLMARGTPFLLPVTIDDTNDRGALVPDSFLAVQWTKLPGGETPPAFVARVQKLLAGDGAGVADPGGLPRHDQPGSATPTTAKLPKWLRPILASAALVIIALAVTLFKQRDHAPSPSPAAPAPAPAVAAAPVSPARELVAKAYVLLRGMDATREDFALAEEYCQRAMKLDPDDGEVWAAYSQLHAAFGYRGWDSSAERREQSRLTAERAIRLLPHSVNARLAQAGAWAAFGVNRDEREKLLREIVREEPDNQGALRFLAVTVLSGPGGLEECLAINERSAALPGGDPLALFNNARYLWQRGRLTEGYATLQRALAGQKFTSGLVLKMAMEINWRGDLAAAEETLRQLPPAALLEDRANYEAGLLHYYQRDAAAALATWQAFPRDFYNDFVYDGPKGLLLGLADELDHRDVAARTEWRAALLEVEKKIAAAPNKPGPYYSQAYLLACLGEKPAANDALRTYEQLAGIKYGPGQPMPIGLPQIYARLGRFDEIFAHPPVGLAILRVSPEFEALRADSRYQALIAPREQRTEDREQKTMQTVDEKSVAVLAFADLSAAHDSEYFSDGISEELLNVLAKIPNLKVTARTSAFYFKGKDVPIPEIAQKLGVAYVVEGSVRRQGDKVRITAQLIKADGGFHVWSDTFTRDLKDIFAVQDEIAGLIAKNLELKMGIGEVVARQAVSPEAYQEYLLGRSAVAKAGMADLREAVVHFERAVALEPKYTAAWVQLASAHTQLGRWGGAPTLQSWASARAAIDRARALEPDSPEVLLALGWILRTSDWNWKGAEQAFRRALALQPNQPEILAGAAVLLFNVGKTEEAFRLAIRAVQLDPLNAASQVDLSIMFHENNNSAEAERAARRALQLAPGGSSYHSILAWSLIKQGRYAEAEAEADLENDEVEKPTTYGLIALGRGQGAKAREMLARLEEYARTHGDTADMHQCIAWLYAGLGEKDQAFAALEKARASRDPSMSWLRNSGYLATLYSDPRWNALLHQIGLADEQLK